MGHRSVLAINHGTTGLSSSEVLFVTVISPSNQHFSIFIFAVSGKTVRYSRLEMDRPRRSRASSRLTSEHFCEFGQVRRRQETMHSYHLEEVQSTLDRSLVFGKNKLRWLAIATFCLICFAVFFTQGHFRTSSQLSVTGLGVTHHRRQADSSTALEDFEVSTPVNAPSTACQVTLMEYSFRNSYGHPFVGKSSDVSCLFFISLKVQCRAAGSLFGPSAASQQSIHNTHEMSPALSILVHTLSTFCDSYRCKSLKVPLVAVHPSALCTIRCRYVRTIAVKD